MNAIIASLVITTNSFGVVCLDAADGTNAICRVGEPGPSLVTSVSLARRDSPTNWRECVYGDPSAAPTNVVYSVDLIASLGKVVGADRYQVVKAALEATPVNGAPAWDLLSSAMYIPDSDPRLGAAKSALAAAGVLTEEEFDRIIALAKSDEPTKDE